MIRKRPSCITLLPVIAQLLVSCATKETCQRFDASAYGKRTSPRIVADAPGNEDVNGFLPDEVFIKTRTQTFCSTHQFCLVDGRIYFKRLPPEGDGDKWRLLLKTGLPRSDENGFVAPKRIAEISADADALFALSDEGRLYRVYFGIKNLNPSLAWKDAFGWPFVSPIELNDLVSDKIAWSLGARRDQVLWYDDPNGNQHHFGTMGIETLYFLRGDGQEIRYADTGLPSDFSHGLLGPERGSFIARGLSASASTVFVIDDAGVAYTRLADFDTLGCDPMFFKYTYEKEHYGLAGSDYRSNFTPWALPNEPWRRQPPVPLTGAARLASRITILQTGQGNAARELRIAGLSPEGKTGFYRKMIFDDGWTFRQAPLALASTDFLDDDAVASGSGARGARRERSYRGALYEGTRAEEDLSFEIPDFPMAEGDCTLTIRRGAETASFVIHPVEVWTYLKRYDPGLDGTPRLFHVTMKLPETRFSGVSSAFRKRLEALLGPLDSVLFSSRLEATDRYLYLELGKDQPEPRYVFLTADGVPALDKDLVRKSLSYSDRLVGRYLDEELLISSAGELSIRNRSKIERVIELNERYRGEVVAELELFRSYRDSAGLSRWGYGAVDLLTSVTFLDQIDFPKIKTMTSYGDRIMEANDKSYADMAEAREWIYSKIIELLDLRIAEYKRVIAAFDADSITAGLSLRFREDFTGYFDLIGIPLSIDGVNPSNKGRYASLRAMPEMPLFPGFILTMDTPKKKDPDATSSILVELEDAAKVSFALDGNPERSRPFRVRIVLHAMTPGGELTQAKDDRRGYLEWDGSVLRIWRERPFFIKQLIFTSRPTGE